MKGGFRVPGGFRQGSRPMVRASATATHRPSSRKGRKAAARWRRLVRRYGWVPR